MKHLDSSVLATLTGVEKPNYDRSQLQTGMVHVGVGGFHRAHQAVYTEQTLNSGDLRWGTVGASLQSTRTRDALAPQDFLYTVAARDSDQESLVIHGGLTGMVTDSDALLAAISNPEVKVVTLTITEKGYGEGGVAAILAAAIKTRMQYGAPLTCVSCDNLMGNGQVLRESVQSASDANVQNWMRDNVSFPSTMVDRITPQTTATDIERIAALGGYQDNAPVVCEPFSQWVIEDEFRTERPPWEMAGALLVSDVAPYEQAKLRMLNASHSMFAYLGLLKGYEYVHEAASDKRLNQFVLDALDQEIIPNIEVPAGMDANEYVQSIMQRFQNSAVPYRTAQVASDGSAKLPQRIYPTAQTIWARGEAAPRLELAISAWFATLRDSRFDYPDPARQDTRSPREAYWQSFPAEVQERLVGIYDELGAGGLDARLTLSVEK